MNDETTRRNGPMPYYPREQSLTPMDVPHTGGAVEYFSNYWRRLSVESKSRVFHALIGLINAQEAAIDAKISFELALTRLEKLEELKAAEAFRVVSEITDQRIKLNSERIRLVNERRQLLIEKMRLDLEYEEAKERLDRKRNPPQPVPKETRDPNLDKLRATLYGGGKYTQEAEDMIDELTRRRGGEDKLKPEDHDHIRNIRLEAKRLDQEKGRR